MKICAKGSILFSLFLVKKYWRDLIFVILAVEDVHSKLDAAGVDESLDKVLDTAGNLGIAWQHLVHTMELLTRLDREAVKKNGIF